MILAAADPGATSAFGWAYVASVIGFLLALGVFCAVGVWLLDRAATRRLHRKVTRARRALDNGDANILRAVEAAEQSRRHNSVPRRLEGTRR